ncbi:ribbon-helix-helix domain-containing protein [Rhizobium halophilum]|uniref:ribbon-helix-helix domain-containing protein n=1 Tax=Rhizobium halophilum TaxID=2846852 RepID=UPI001EFDDAFF|nr:type II toxin-antitoxin system ParD family antitoxin [Rhizobium halophilum]MCF6367823.1 type II toxin-antitoxin system ParD family antitoxin [Rhizobium halophilum]
MVTVTVSLPESAKDWLDEQVRRGPYATAGDYLTQLILRERAQRGEELTIEELRDLLSASRHSGVSPRKVSEFFSEAEKVAEQWKAGRG